MSAFDQLATPLVGDDVTATATLGVRPDATTDGSVQVWSIAGQRPQAEFDTVLDFGGRRLAICAAHDRTVVVAGAWGRHGICGYDATTGERLWQRKDLTKVQSVNPAAGDAVAACFDTRPMHLLDLATGGTIATVRGVRRFWQSPYKPMGAAAVLGHVALIRTDDWTVHWRVPVAGFALLSAAFAPDAVLVSNVVDGESDETCSVSCFSLTGQLLWQRHTPPETNVRWLGWDAEADEWLGIRYNVEHRETETLLRWSREGELVSRVPLGRIGEYAIMPGGKLLVTGQGDVVETKTATRVGRLPPTARQAP